MKVLPTTLLRAALGATAAALLTACGETSMNFPVQRKAAEERASDVLPNVEVVQVTAETLPSSAESRVRPSYDVLPSVSWAYRVGVGDLLRVVLWDEPSRSDIGDSVSPSVSPNHSVYRVQSDGRFFFPFVGYVDAEGKTADEIRVQLTTRMRSIVLNPQIQVELDEYRSQAVSVTGEVKNPTNVFLADAPLRVLDAINAAGGFSEGADERVVTIRRNGKVYGAHIEDFVSSPGTSTNGILVDGDVVKVTRAQVRQAYMLGSFSDPAPIPLGDQPVSLTQAISTAGGLIDGDADARGIFVFRETTGGFTVYQLDGSNPASLVLGTRFEIHDRDVIYVTTAPLHRWNRIISDILPTITVVGSANSVAEN